MREWDFSTGPRGLTLRICEWGEPRPGVLPKLVLHGYLEQGAAWHAVATHLGGHVFAPDHRGHGLSEHVGAGGFYHFWDYISDVDALVTHLGGKVDLIGHSMGGTIASLYAGARPETVRKLVLIEGLGPPDASAESPTERARLFLLHRRHLPDHSPVADLDDAVRRMRKFNPRLPLETAQALAARILRPRPEGGLTWTWDPQHRSRSAIPFVAANFAQFLAAIDAPTLLIDGAHGFSVPDADWRASHLKNAQRVRIDDAGHLLHHDQPAELARVIVAFLDAS